MVADRDRGQLLLVGAVVIALALVGITVAINATVFTETAGDQGTNAAVDAGDRMIYQMERGAATGVAAVDKIDGKQSEYESVENDLTALFRQAVSERTGAYVTITEVSSAEEGYRVTSTPTNKTLLNGTDGSVDEIGRIRISNVSDSTMKLTVENDTMSEEITIQQTRQINRVPGVTQPHTLRTDNTNIDLTLAYDGDQSAYEGGGGTPAEVSWTINVGYVYETDEVTYEGTATDVKVYP